MVLLGSVASVSVVVCDVAASVVGSASVSAGIVFAAAASGPVLLL